MLTNSSPPRTYSDWYPETRSLFQALKAAGFLIEEIDNGGDSDFVLKCDANTPEEKMLSEATACDECHVCATKNGKRVWLYLVFGNNPGELACDFNTNDKLDGLSLRTVKSGLTASNPDQLERLQARYAQTKA